MTIKNYGVIILSILCLVLLSVMGVGAARSPKLARQAIGSGEHLEQGIYNLHNTLGQPVTGKYSQRGTSLCVGFWCHNNRFHYIYLPLVMRHRGE